MIKNDKKQITKISIFITSIFVIFISISYAFFTRTLEGIRKQVINAGVLDLVLEEDSAITISNAYPMYDEVGMIQEDVYKFRLINNTSNSTSYILKLNKVNTSNLDESLVKYGLIKDGETTIALLSTLEDGIIDEGTVVGNDTIEYELRLWINNTVKNLDDIQGKSLSYKITAEASVVEENNSGSDTLNWSGNTDGLEFVNLDGTNYYLVDDATPNIDDMTNGITVTMSDGYVYETSNEMLHTIAGLEGYNAIFASGGVLLGNQLIVVPTDNYRLVFAKYNIDVIIPKAGVYLPISSSQIYPTSITIPGYTGFPAQ